MVHCIENTLQLQIRMFVVVCMLLLLYQANMASMPSLSCLAYPVYFHAFNGLCLSLLPPRFLYAHTLHTTSIPRSKDRIIYYRYIEKDDLVIKNVTSTLVAHNCSGSVSSNDW